MEANNKGWRKLNRERLRLRLQELETSVVEEHAQCRHASGESLNHARNAGAALIEIKKYLGHRSKWGNHSRRIAKEFGLSRRTQRIYMQVARHWDDPRIRKAISDGVTIETIQGFLNLLRSKHVQQDKARNNAVDELNDLRRAVRIAFGAVVRRLSKDQLSGLVLYLELHNQDFVNVLCREGQPFISFNECEPPSLGEYDSSARRRAANLRRTIRRGRSSPSGQYTGAAIMNQRRFGKKLILGSMDSAMLRPGVGEKHSAPNRVH